MSVYYFKELPSYYMEGFSPVRDAFDNLANVLKVVEIVNTCQNHITLEYVENFDFAIFSGGCNRVLVRKNNGYFTMSIPFQIVDHGDIISFNFDLIDEEVDGLFLSVMRNAIAVSKNTYISCDDIVLSISETFGLSVPESIMYCDAFLSLLADDHGYFRFDDDPKNENGDLHPRFHFDFFYKNSSTIKIGSKSFVDMDCFNSLFDKSVPKMYLKR